MEDIKCPVCGKSGIPDYHSDDVICPQCKSDLSIYRVIDKIPVNSSKMNVWKPISVVAIIVAALIGILFVLNYSKDNTIADQTKHDVCQLQDSITMLNDSLSVLNKSLIKIQDKHVESTVIPSGFPYIVRRGDSFWSISMKMYGTGEKATEIAEKNNRTIKSPLYVGDTLRIE